MLSKARLRNEALAQLDRAPWFAPGGREFESPTPGVLYPFRFALAGFGFASGLFRPVPVPDGLARFHNRWSLFEFFGGAFLKQWDLSRISKIRSRS